MNITSKVFVEQIIKDDKEENWDVEDNRYFINQHYSDNKDWNGLEEFYIEALKLVLKEKDLEKVLSYDFKEYKEALLVHLKEANELAKKDKTLKVIYYEYEMSSNTGSFFLCNRYSTEAWDDFPSDFEIDNIVDTPSLKNIFFDYYDEFEILDENYTIEIIRRYFDAKLTSLLGQVSSEVDLVVPLSMSEHDFQVLHYN